MGFERPQLHSIAVGMQSIAEIETNVAIARGITPVEYLNQLKIKQEGFILMNTVKVVAAVLINVPIMLCK